MVSAGGNVLLGCVGMAVAVVSGSQAILLDGLFNWTYFAAGLFTVKVAALVARGDDGRFPHGYSFFEPLVNGMKGMLVLGVSVLALVGAVQSLCSGGREINAGAAIGYGIFATISCAVLAWIMRRGAQITSSPLVRADAENWYVNAAISSCVLLAFASILVLYALDWAALVPFVDPVLVILVVLISISVPVRMSWHALMALLNRAPSEQIIQQVGRIVDASLADLPVQERFVRVIQPGRQRLVFVHVVLPPDFEPVRLPTLDAIRQETHNALSRVYAGTIVDILFTSDRQWGAPLSDGGAGGLSPT